MIQISFDKFIDQRVGLGRAQYFTIFCLFLVDVNDGAQTVLSSFLNPIVKLEMGLHSFQLQILSSIFYLGILFGSLVSGKLADFYGRRPVILAGSFVHFIVCCLFLFISNFVQVVIVRFLYGFTHGLTIVLTTAMFSQIINSKWRGKGLLILNFCATLGKIFSVGLASIFLTDFSHGNWRMMMFMSSITCLIVLFFGYFKIKQSSRFLLACGQYEKSFNILNQMIKQNHPNTYLPINQQQKQCLISWKQSNFKNLKRAEFKSLFSPQYKVITLSLFSAWFTANFMYHGQLVILPFLFQKQHLSFGQYALTVFGEAPTLLLSLYMIDKRKFGRKRSLILFFGLSGFFHFIFCFKSTTLISSISRFFMKSCFQILYPFTTESFGTLNRTIGVGSCGATGRFGAFIMPYIIIPLLQISKQLVFSSFVLVSVLGMISSAFVPHDTLGRGLDESNKKKNQVCNQLENKSDYVQLIKDNKNIIYN